MTADVVARAIVAAARETGADPLAMASGVDHQTYGYPVKDKLRVSRARAYAGRALDRVFNQPEVTVARPVIAKLIGANKPSCGSFFSTLDGRTLPWWDKAAYQRVISAIEAGWVRPRPSSAPAATPEPPVISSNHRFSGVATKPHIGTLDDGGFRPAPDTIKRVLQDDEADKRFLAPYVPVGRPVLKKDDDFLRRAVENTAKMTPPPEE